MTKIRIVYSSRMRDTALPHDADGTNGFIQSVDENYTLNNNTASIVFTLRDTPIAQQFVETWNKNKLGDTGTDSDFRIDYNEFTSIDSETRYKMQQQMNDIIDAINKITTEYPVPQDLKLTISDNIQVEKLNALHRYFEDTSYDLIQGNGLRDNNLHSLLENVNQLVHKMEGPSNNHKLFMTVIRNLQKINIKKFYQLQDHDFDEFEPVERQGVLFLDFATVGKDLAACFYTNDIPLVQAKEVKQQEYCMPYFNYRFTTLGEGKDDRDWKNYYNTEMNKYYDWCNKNDVWRFYDYKQPKYRLGRIAIGDIDEEFTVTDYLELISKKPYITGVYLEE